MRSCRCAIVQAILSLLLCVRRSYVYACFPVCSFTRSAVARSLPLMASWNRAFTVCTRCVTRQAMGRRRAVATEARAHPHLTSLFLFNDIVSCLLEIAPRPRAPPRGTAPTAALARPPASHRPGAPGAAQLGRSGARPRRELGETSGSRKRSFCRKLSSMLAGHLQIPFPSTLSPRWDGGLRSGRGGRYHVQSCDRGGHARQYPGPCRVRDDNAGGDALAGQGMAGRT